MQNQDYALISVCRNEQDYIEGLIDCIAAQTIRPLRWVIVDDGSSDTTFERATARAKNLPFIQVARMTGGRPRSFSSKVFALQRGCELVAGIPSTFIGFLDADVSVDPTYYQTLIGFFHENPRLGLGGGIVIDKYETHTEDSRKGSEDFHVAGGVHFFRRECFDQIGGYIPVDAGGEDSIADVMVMMRGWQVHAFRELQALHLRPDGIAQTKLFQRGMRWGRRFYMMGYHPLFYVAHCIKRVKCRPFLIGACIQLLGFVVETVKGEQRPVSPEFIRFIRKMQMDRLRQLFSLSRRQHRDELQPRCRPDPLSY